MEENFTGIFMHIFTFIHLVCAKRDTSYFVTTFASHSQDSKSNASMPLDYHFRYKNLSIRTKFIELPSTSGLSQVISTLSSVLLQNGTAKDGKDIFHLSHITEEKRKLLKEVFWKRKQVSSDVVKCSQVSIFHDYDIYRAYSCSGLCRYKFIQSAWQN